MTKITTSVLLTFVALISSAAAANLIINGDFESPNISTATTVGQNLNGDGFNDVTAVYVSGGIVGIQDKPNPIMLGWTTDDPLGFEVWRTGASAPNNFAAASGSQWIELNHTINSTQTQVMVNPFSMGTGTLAFSHRGRSGVDVMRVQLFDLGSDGAIGGGDDVSLFLNSSISDGNTAWGNYSFSGISFTNNNNIGLAMSVISTSTGDTKVGNFIDNISFNVIPEPTSSAILAVASLFGLLRRRR